MASVCAFLSGARPPGYLTSYEKAPRRFQLTMIPTKLVSVSSKCPFPAVLTVTLVTDLRTRSDLTDFLFAAQFV